MNPKVLFDIRVLLPMVLDDRVRMSGILRVVDEWGRRLVERGNVVWAGTVSERLWTGVSHFDREFEWTAPRRGFDSHGAEDSPGALRLLRWLQPALAKKEWRKTDVSLRLKKKLGFPLLEWIGRRDAGTVIRRAQRNSGSFVYHMPYTGRMPLNMPPTCIPLMSVYDLVPLVFTDSYTRSFRKQFADNIRLAHDAGAHFLVNARVTRHAMVCSFGIPASHVHVVPFGADAAPTPAAGQENPPAPDSSPPYFLYVSSGAQRRKNIPAVVEAFQILRQQTSEDYRLIIVGEGTAGIVANLQSAGSGTTGVQAMGGIPAALLESLYAGALCGVYLSLYEGFGLPVLECMRRGLPVICSSVSSLPEVAGDAAMLVNPLDTAEIAAAMKRMAEDSGLREKFRAAGLHRSAQFSWGHSFRVLSALYEKLANQN